MLAIINIAVGVTVLAVMCAPFFLHQHTTAKLEGDSESIGIIGGSNAPTAVWMSSKNGYEVWLCPVALCTLFVANALVLFNSVKRP